MTVLATERRSPVLDSACAVEGVGRRPRARRRSAAARPPAKSGRPAKRRRGRIGRVDFLVWPDSRDETPSTRHG
jgi:hypothetical protein